MDKHTCACPNCNCSVDDSAIERDGKRYCCEACASGHSAGQGCRMGGCGCAKSAGGSSQSGNPH